MPEVSTIPIFPLDNVVLFPGVQVPLFIFEPRYRQMTAASLADDRRIGMVVVKPEHRGEIGQEPPVFPVGCAGRIEQAEPHEDGTYHIVLQGTNRFRIRSEVPRQGERLYRVAEVEPLADAAPAPPDVLAPLRERILDLMRHLVPDRADRFQSQTFARLDDTTFVNAFCQSLDFSPLEKQQLLEANGVRARAEQLVALMDFGIAAHATTPSPSSETVH
jgi:Lon protease-like protein